MPRPPVSPGRSKPSRPRSRKPRNPSRPSRPRPNDPEDLRTKEKDLEVVTAKRTKAEGRLWEVKNNTEYSAVLSEIEAIKQEKAKGEEEILGLMEIQERLAVEGREADVRLKAREEQAQQDEAVVRKKLAAVEKELAALRADRTLARGSFPPAPGRL
jgi:predicted  nucleic acid-binding Zn-ribbon protein